MLTEIKTPFNKLTHEEIIELHHDYSKTAKTVRLRYVNDTMPGISRVKKGKGFTYYQDTRRVTDPEVLERVRKLVIPPAWTNVWICPLENGHIQATGYDVKKRKQYRYHNLWSVVRNETKFHKLYEFGKVLPLLRVQVEKDLTLKDLNQPRVVATVISLMERTYIRIGSEDYEKLYGSHGITTLKDSHVKINGSEIKFSFTGKKGIAHSISIKNRRLARIVKECRDIPGKELFQYYDENGDRHVIESGMINDYIKEATGADFTAKDFRTWAGSLNFLRALRSIGEAVTVKDCKKNLVMALDEVSKKLGNTRTVCKKYYVHPGLIDLYEKQNLSKYLKELDEIEEPDLKADLTTDEKIFMRILKALK